MTCSRPQQTATRPGLELGTPWSVVCDPNHRPPTSWFMNYFIKNQDENRFCFDSAHIQFTYFSSMFCFSVKPRDVEADAHVEGNLAAEISMVALDTLELVIQVGY